MYQAGGISNGSLYLRFKSSPRAKTFVLFAGGIRQDPCERLDDTGRFVPFTAPLDGAGDGLYRYALCRTPLAFLEFHDGSGFTALSPVIGLSCADGFDCWLADAEQPRIARVTPDELFGRETGYTVPEHRLPAAAGPASAEPAVQAPPPPSRRLRRAAAAAMLALVLAAGILPLCRRDDSPHLPQPQSAQAQQPASVPSGGGQDALPSAAPEVTPPSASSGSEAAPDASVPSAPEDIPLPAAEPVSVQDPALMQDPDSMQDPTLVQDPVPEQGPAPEQDPVPEQGPAPTQDPPPIPEAVPGANDLAAALEGTHLRLEQLWKIILLCRVPVSDTVGVAHGEWQAASESAAAQSLPEGVDPSAQLRRIDIASIDALYRLYYRDYLSVDAFCSVIAPTLIEADGSVYELRSPSVLNPDPDTLQIEVLSPWICVCSMQAVGSPDVTLSYNFSSANGSEKLTSVR